MRYFTNPNSDKPDPMLTITIIAISVACLKFLLEGLSITVDGHVIDFGHVDALAYGSLLTPILGMHGWVNRPQAVPPPKLKVDNPDKP